MAWLARVAVGYSQHLDDVLRVREIHWERYRVDFEYQRNGRTYATSLALLQ